MVMEDIASMANDRLLVSFAANVECEAVGGAMGMSPVTAEMRDEILRRMDSDARRVDVLPDGHRV